LNESGAPASVTRFDGLAEIYERYRPGYPLDAIEAILAGLPPQPTVIDIGAGTGISTRALAEAGAHAIAIEPNDDMRALAISLGTDARPGTATATGLANRCADAITSFQAFHWFANATALREFRRLLRDPGRIALVWNDRELRDPFTAAMRELEARLGEASMLATIDFSDDKLEPLLREGGFGSIQVRTFANSQRMDEEQLLGRVRSLSFAPREGQAFDEMIAELQNLFARFVDGTNRVELRYRTDVIVAEPLA